MEAEQRRAVAFTQGQERLVAQTLRLLIAHVTGQQRAQLAHRRSYHDLTGRDLAGKVATQTCGKTHRQQRVPAEGKEIGLDVVDLAAQQGRKRRRNRLFRVAFRGAPRGFHRQFRQRQRLAIQLAVGAERQRA